jgi:hypothetical protein
MLESPFRDFTPVLLSLHQDIRLFGVHFLSIFHFQGFNRAFRFLSALVVSFNRFVIFSGLCCYLGLGVFEVKFQSFLNIVVLVKKESTTLLYP